jgi:signal peptidase I
MIADLIITLLATILLGIAVALFILFLFPVIHICGYSMFPTLSDGEFYMSKRVFRKSKCKIGKIYVYRPPYDGGEEKFVIKRLAYIKDGKYFFLGDNADDSYDSRYYGYVDSKNVVAQLITRKEVLK